MRKTRIIAKSICLAMCFLILTGCSKGNSDPENTATGNMSEVSDAEQENEDTIHQEYGDFSKEYTVYGANYRFYYPDQPVTAADPVGFNVIENGSFNHKLSLTYYNGSIDESLYSATVITPMKQNAIKELKEEITLDNVVALCEEQLLYDCNLYRELEEIGINNPKQVAENREQVVINDVPMLRVEGYYEDTQNTAAETYPYIAYYMIANDSDGVAMPIVYIGLSKHSNFELMKDYIETSIQYVQHASSYIS